MRETVDWQSLETNRFRQQSLKAHHSAPHHPRPYSRGIWHLEDVGSY